MKKQNENKLAILKTLDGLDDGQLAKTLGFLEKLTAPKKLLSVFEEKLKEIGNTPMQEVEIAKKQKELEDENKLAVKAMTIQKQIESIDNIAKVNKLELTKLAEIKNAILDIELENADFIAKRIDEVIEFLNEHNIKKDEIDEFIEDKQKDEVDMLLEILECVYSVDELDKIQSETKFELNNLVEFAESITEKVFEYKELNEKGEQVFKEIECQDELKPISYISQKNIRKAQNALNNVIEKIQTDFGNQDMSSMLELNKKLEEKGKVVDALVKKAHDLNTAEMSDWEKQLLKQKVIENAFGRYMPLVGKK